MAKATGWNLHMEGRAGAYRSHKRAKNCGVIIIIFFQLLQGVGSADKNIVIQNEISDQ